MSVLKKKVNDRRVESSGNKEVTESQKSSVLVKDQDVECKPAIDYDVDPQILAYLRGLNHDLEVLELKKQNCELKTEMEKIKLDQLRLRRNVIIQVIAIERGLEGNWTIADNKLTPLAENK